MNEFCNPLYMPKNLFLENFNIYKLPRNRHTKLHYKLLLPEINQIFESLNLAISLVEVFYSTPYFTGGIHSDSDGGDFTKINWIFGGTNSIMCWYFPNDIRSAIPNQKTGIGTKSVSHRYSNCELLYSEKITTPSLVQVGIPHNVINLSEERWCVSVVFYDKLTGRRPTMQESIQLFKDYIS